VSASGGKVIYVRDVAHVRDGYAPQTNIVRTNGNRSALLQIEKSGNASTLAIIANVKAMLPQIAAGLPKALGIQPVSDQSVFVSSAVSGVVREALIAAALTGLMILLFLANWRATLDHCRHHPALDLDLADCTVGTGTEHQHHDFGRTRTGGGHSSGRRHGSHRKHQPSPRGRHRKARSDSPGFRADRGADPGLDLVHLQSCSFRCFSCPGWLVICSCPWGRAVVFAMLASYFFSTHLDSDAGQCIYCRAPGQHSADAAKTAWALHALSAPLRARFRRVSRLLPRTSEWGLARPRALAIGFPGSVPGYRGAGAVFWARTSSPTSDTGEIRLHLRAKTGTRIEETARITDNVEARIRSVIPKAELGSILDNIGLPVSGINLTYAFRVADRQCGRRCPGHAQCQNTGRRRSTCRRCGPP